MTSPRRPIFFRYLSWKARSKSCTVPRGDRISSSSLITRDQRNLPIPCTASRITTRTSSAKGTSSFGSTKTNETPSNIRSTSWRSRSPCYLRVHPRCRKHRRSCGSILAISEKLLCRDGRTSIRSRFSLEEPATRPGAPLCGLSPGPPTENGRPKPAAANGRGYAPWPGRGRARSRSP